MSDSVITDVEEINYMHYDAEVDDLYENMRSQFPFIVEAEQQMIARHDKQIKYLRKYHELHKSTNSQLAKRRL